MEAVQVAHCCTQMTMGFRLKSGFESGSTLRECENLPMSFRVSALGFLNLQFRNKSTYLTYYNVVRIKPNGFNINGLVNDHRGRLLTCIAFS